MPRLEQYALLEKTLRSDLAFAESEYKRWSALANKFNDSFRHDCLNKASCRVLELRRLIKILDE